MLRFPPSLSLHAFMRPSTSRTQWIILAIMTILLFAEARIYLDIWLLRYVNHVLANIKGYEGSVESIRVDLCRGAYRMNNLRIDKKDAAIPTPFIAIQKTDFSIHWEALLHGRIVSSVRLTKPVINFAVKDKDNQTGKEADWTNPIKNLMPVDINVISFESGKLTYQDFASHPQVNIYIRNMDGDIRNLRNVVDASKPLPSTIKVQGDSIGGGKLSIKGRMNVLKDVPDMDLQTQLENVNLTALNNYSDAYGNFDFKDGVFNLYSDFIVKHKQVSGYIKPILQHVSIVGLKEESNPFKLAWEEVISGAVTLFSNHSHDQFATEIPLTGNLGNVQTDTWSAIIGILHNAFIDAIRKGLNADGESSLLKQSK